MLPRLIKSTVFLINLGKMDILEESGQWVENVDPSSAGKWQASATKKMHYFKVEHILWLKAFYA